MVPSDGRGGARGDAPGVEAGPGRRCLTLAYDGADFSGWQVQPGRPTVQGVVEQALSEVTGEAIRVQGAGRTDAGVHALGQVCHFDEPRGLGAERLFGALSALLPEAVRPVDLASAPQDFHALHSAWLKTYVYRLHLSRVRGGKRAVERSVPPLRRRTHHSVRDDLDLPAMRRAAAALVGTHDFTALSKAMPTGRTTIKTVRHVRLLRMPRGLAIVVTGEGFLYGMVRLMAALLVDVGQGRRTAAGVPRLLEGRDRAVAPALLPAHGLVLGRVHYRPDPRRRDPRRPDPWGGVLGGRLLS